MQPWLKIMLPSPANVFGVTVTHRLDCCRWRFQGIQVHVEEEGDRDRNRQRPCGVAGDGVEAESSVDCGGVRGRVVTLAKIMSEEAERYLEVNEVRIEVAEEEEERRYKGERSSI